MSDFGKGVLLGIATNVACVVCVIEWVTWGSLLGRVGLTMTAAALSLASLRAMVS